MAVDKICVVYITINLCFPFNHRCECVGVGYPPVDRETFPPATDGGGVHESLCHHSQSNRGKMGVPNVANLVVEIAQEWG